LSPAQLRDLATAIRTGGSDGRLPVHALQQLTGSEVAVRLHESLSELSDAGWQGEQLATLAAAIADAKQDTPESYLDLVLSGPEAAGIPTRDTSAVMHSLVEKAEKQIILVGYAVYDCGVLFKALAESMQQQPDLDVWFCLNMFRKHRDTTLASEIVRRFRAEFAKKHWPWEPKPAIYYDPRSLSTDGSKRASLHAKCLIADRSVALVTSANFTEAAQHRNVEVGVVIQYQPLVERLASYFDALRESGVFARCSP
jgi:phosphatidylserine/phosphatidylglycerophosphate/cardiolipin synthase-like enzyme